MTGFDLEARHVTAAQPGGRLLNLSYDSLIAAEGAGQSYFGHDEYAEWAPGMKTLADALDHRARIFGAFGMAELEDDPEIRRAWLTFAVIVGGSDRHRDRWPYRGAVEAVTQTQFAAI